MPADRYSAAMTRHFPLLPVLALLAAGNVHAAEIAPPAPAWGELTAVPGEPGSFTSEVPEHENDTTLALPTPFPNIVRARLEGEAIPLSFNEDASEILLGIPAGQSGQLRLELAENTAQTTDGRILFSALDAKVEGTQAKLETHPGSHRIGFWNKVEDKVNWPYKPTRPGMYDIAMTYSLASGSSKVKVEFGGETREVELAATGSWYHYTSVPVGRVYLEDDRKKTALTVTPVSKTGGAVMNLKAVILDPAPEGKDIIQDSDTITLHSRDATVHGVKMRYEPQPKKLCLGYWANPADWAHWDFTVNTPGTYKLVLRQGCGKGHGGSTAKFILGEQNIEFTVEDTGGFQNWKDRELGTLTLAKAGPQRLEIRPITKASVAVMDIRQVELVRVKE